MIVWSIKGICRLTGVRMYYVCMILTKKYLSRLAFHHCDLGDARIWRVASQLSICIYIYICIHIFGYFMLYTVYIYIYIHIIYSVLCIYIYTYIYIYICILLYIYIIILFFIYYIYACITVYTHEFPRHVGFPCHGLSEPNSPAGVY